MAECSSFGLVAHKLRLASSKAKTKPEKLTPPKARTPVVGFTKDLQFLMRYCRWNSCVEQFWPTVCFVVLYARACLLKDDSSQACLDHAVRMINRERWS